VSTTKDIEARLAGIAPMLKPGLRAQLAAQGRRLQLPDGSRIFAPGDRSEGFVLLLRGTVRVEHTGSSGRSVVLYRVGPGDSCVMTTSCLLSGTAYDAYGYTEGEVEAIILPATAFRTLIEDDAAFRDLALGTFSRRIIELVEVIDELLLHRVDLRVAGWLAERAATSTATTVSIATTHQAIAAELGTAREVVSRILKDFERRGWLTITRGAIELLEPAALRRFASQEPL
jgi:CRP/FNR family transcriptional regulator, anaerobic regulatory protein